MTYNEEVADFRKLSFIEDKDYLKTKQALKKATDKDLTKTFLMYCKAVIKQHKNGMLSVREASYAISSCGQEATEADTQINSIIKMAYILRRHPSNYKESHDEGWTQLVKMVNGLN